MSLSPETRRKVDGILEAGERLALDVETVAGEIPATQALAVKLIAHGIRALLTFFERVNEPDGIDLTPENGEPVPVSHG